MKFAVIFDMDGVLADVHEAIAAGHKKVFAAHGIKEFKSYFGLALPDKIPTWEKEFGIKLTEKEFKKAGKEEFEKIKHKLKAPPELTVFLEELKQREVPVAVATVSNKPRAQRILEAVGIQDYFDVIITRDDDIQNRKPAPDIYLKAAEKLGIPPEQCIAIEDSPVGAQAAKNAGMKVIGFSNKWRDSGELTPFCKLIVKSFSELSYTGVKNLLEASQ